MLSNLISHRTREAGTVSPSSVDAMLSWSKQYQIGRSVTLSTDCMAVMESVRSLGLRAEADMASGGSLSILSTDHASLGEGVPLYSE